MAEAAQESERAVIPWGPEQETRLQDLLAEVVDALEAGAGRDAVKEVVPAHAGCSSIQQLADELQEHRSSLTVCLAGDQLHYRIRRKLDQRLGLVPGGMEQVMALLEANTSTVH